MRDRETWLDTELACLTPLRPDVGMSIVDLKDRTEPGRASCEFYDEKYLKDRFEGKYLGRYRKVTAAESLIEAPGKADCELVLAGGPRLTGSAYLTASPPPAVGRETIPKGDICSLR